MEQYTTLKLIKIDPERIVKIGTDEYLIIDETPMAMEVKPKMRNPKPMPDGLNRVDLRNNMCQIITNSPGIAFRNIVSQLDEQYRNCSIHTFKNALQTLKRDGRIYPVGERIDTVWYPVEEK